MEKEKEEEEGKRLRLRKLSTVEVCIIISNKVHFSAEPFVTARVKAIT